MTYLDDFNGRVAASRTTEVEAANGMIELALDSYAAGLLRLTVHVDTTDAEACAKMTAAQLRRLIADLQSKLGCLTRDE